jgi:glutamine---fructose-6-phosphate transaminase (isomerizing)
MNSKDEKYSRYEIVKEMMETPDIIRSFDPSASSVFASAVLSRKKLFLTGEGSSRIFPACRAISANMKKGSGITVLTEGASQALEYNLKDFAVFAASNSGQTKEVIRLVSALKNEGHDAVFGLTANINTKLEAVAVMTHILSCGKENAVAATKSVIEQGLFYDSLLRSVNHEKMDGLEKLADNVEEALTMKIDPSVIEIIRKAGIIYFAGRNNGVAEELALKTNEITRKKSAYLEGTFAVHGIEEVMNSNEVLIWIAPFSEEESKFSECLVRGVGMNIISVSSRKTMFPNIAIPDSDDYAEYIQLAAGWNMLIETGLALGIDPDKPSRARKVGNEYLPG